MFVGLLYGKSLPDITSNNVAYGHKPTGPDRTGKKCFSLTSRGFVSPGMMVGFAFIVEGMSITPRPVLWSGSIWRWKVRHGLGWCVTASSELVVIAGNRNTVLYREDILLPHVVPCLQTHPDMTLQHDNAISHTARSVRVSVLPWPAKSLDLNPIEHIWDLLDRRVRARAIPPQKCPGTCRCLGGRVGRVTSHSKNGQIWCSP